VTRALHVILGAMSVVAVFQLASSGSLPAGPAARSFLVIRPGSRQRPYGRGPAARMAL